jgi:hypothetical protein
MRELVVQRAGWFNHLHIARARGHHVVGVADVHVSSDVGERQPSSWAPVVSLVGTGSASAMWLTLGTLCRHVGALDAGYRHDVRQPQHIE